MQQWTKLKSRRVLNTPWLSLRQDTYETTMGKRIPDYYILERADFVVIVPKTDAGTYMLIKQYRPGASKALWNFPMGYIKKGESPKVAAQRELFEELGCKKPSFAFLGAFFLSPSFTTMKGYVFLASNIGDAAGIRKGPDPDREVLGIKEATERDMSALIRRKMQTDFATVCAYLLGQNDPSSVTGSA